MQAGCTVRHQDWQRSISVISLLALGALNQRHGVHVLPVRATSGLERPEAWPGQMHAHRCQFRRRLRPSQEAMATVDVFRRATETAGSTVPGLPPSF